MCICRLVFGVKYKIVLSIVILFGHQQRSLTGIRDLEEALTLEMKVDTRDNSLGNFGELDDNN